MLWYALWAALHYPTLLGWLAGTNGLWCNLILGLSVWFWSGDMLHSGTHYALTYSNRASIWAGWLAGVLFMSPAAWYRQHLTGHHVHTNVVRWARTSEAVDAEAYGMTIKSNMVMRPAVAMHMA
jgi:hypothetical protein